MYSFKEIVRPHSYEEAWTVLQKSRNNKIIGGGLFIRLGKKRILKGIDLSDLGLDFIERMGSSIRVGSMVTFGRLEDHKVLNNETCGMISKSLSTIVSRQLRNMVTLGGSIVTRFGFSDLIPSLLLLNPNLHFYKYGWISMVDYMKLEKAITKDILLELDFPTMEGQGVYLTQKQTMGDFPMLNMATLHVNDEIKIAVGARPGKAMIAEKTSAFLTESKLNQEVLSQAKEILVEEIPFGRNTRASKEYRRLLAKGLLEKSIKELSDEY